MVCRNIEEAMKAAELATKEDLKGLYPSACRVMADYIKTLYKRIEVEEDGSTKEPVQFVGVYVTQWGKTYQPTDAFVEAIE